VKITAERIKELRKERSLSIHSLAEQIKISHASISRWENCQATINSEQLKILAKFFNVSADYLLGLTD